MSPKVIMTLFCLCVVGLALMIAVRIPCPKATFFAVQRTSSEEFDSDNISENLLEDTNAHLSNDSWNSPLKFVREKGYVRHLVKLDIDKLSTDELLMTIHSYIDNTDILCRRKIRMGNIGDGGWEICDDPVVRPQVPCIVYSFGINNDFSFDDYTAKMYGCHVYSFDPSMTKEKDQFNRSSNVHFYKIGLDGKTYTNNKQWSLLTFRDIRKKLGHLHSTIAVVKMDIENSEWGAIPEMFESGELSSIKQLLIEFHVFNQDYEYLLPKLKAIQAIEKSGLKKFYTHKNGACQQQVNGFPVERTGCYEVHYLRG